MAEVPPSHLKGRSGQDPAAGPTVVTLSLLQPVELTLQRAEDGKPRPRDQRDPEAKGTAHREQGGR